ncbi:sensor histidine kinase [Pontibacter diazotrophicus]|uniref:Sensor histidine kinase n=1 Tax=Pontibacter diazotrophicus TaxID=1400979 RepID=A0A3D8LDY8_9BACT|nr:histidine kinase [Pontibacter diazotrophicus]RDV15162.1 sensor histidine kinase [Pontibacter diazotrophicus]
MNDLTLKNFVDKPIHFSKVEFWAATTIFVFAVLSLLTADSPNKVFFDEAGISFYYHQNYFFPQLIRYTLLYLSFLVLNFLVVPKLIEKKALFLNILLIVVLFLVMGIAIGTIDTYTKNYLFTRFGTQQQTYEHIFQNSFHHAFWLLLMFGFYCVIKYSAVYLLTNSEAIQSKYRMITRDGLAAFVLWMVSMFLLLIVDADVEIVVFWGAAGPCGILLYCYSFYDLIPNSLSKKRPFIAYLLKAVVILIISVIPISLIAMLLTHDEDAAFGISLFNVFFQLFITVPLSWVLFKRHIRGSEEVYVLKNELGRSNANLDFLRSQINPHFLFNTLNTLYGTALQENSERTAQGIQMLGDMMRFMLHENHQQKILLAREIEYMRNYIALQSLRTSTSPDIVIQTKIEDVVAETFIAPMLLIPFVENAFKHGISLKHKSWIRVTLYYEQDKLFFDVYNSTHAKQEQDPEKDKSGVGLENVRQRLALLYPEKHELVIRETLEEFFVHLTLQL